MKIPVSARTEESETRYQEAQSLGDTRDIADMEGVIINTLKISENDFAYDIMHARSDMIIDQSGNFWDYWIKLGELVSSGELNQYDQLVHNFPRLQSQPHVYHSHLLKMKQKREDFKL
jgi:hypothetical protein